MHVIKLLITLIISACTCIAITLLPNQLIFNESDYYTFFIGSTSQNCKVITVSADTAAIKKATLSHICGEAATYSTLDIETFLSKYDGEIIFIEQLSDSTNYYCTASLPYSTEPYGQKINLQICERNDKSVMVGSPIIFGGY